MSYSLYFDANMYKMQLFLLSEILCGRAIGRITRFARPSVRPSVSPSVLYGLVTRKQKKQKNVQKSKLAQTFPRARVSGVPIFS